MSTYTASTITIDADLVGLAGDVLAEYDALRHGMCSRDAAALGSELAAVPLTADSAWARVDQVLPSWRQHLPAPAIEALESARTGSIPLVEALSTVTSQLGAMERLATASLSADSLAGRGYTVERVDGLLTSAVEASRGDEKLLVVVTDGGRVVTDHAGTVGDECVDRQAEYIEAMSERGVLFSEEIAVRHDDPRGGSPITVASRVRSGSLAQGAVLEGDQGSLGTTLFERAPQQARRIAGSTR